jgi:hypothetical protein
VGTKVLDHLRACVKVAYYYDSRSASTLTCIKSLESCVESVFVTVFERFAIADYFLLFW